MCAAEDPKSPREGILMLMSCSIRLANNHHSIPTHPYQPYSHTGYGCLTSSLLCCFLSNITRSVQQHQTDVLFPLSGKDEPSHGQQSSADCSSSSTDSSTWSNPAASAS